MDGRYGQQGATIISAIETQLPIKEQHERTISHLLLLTTHYFIPFRDVRIRLEPFVDVLFIDIHHHRHHQIIIYFIYCCYVNAKFT